MGTLESSRKPWKGVEVCVFVVSTAVWEPCWSSRLRLQRAWKTKPGPSGIKQAQNKHRLRRVKPSSSAHTVSVALSCSLEVEACEKPSAQIAVTFSASSCPLHPPTIHVTAGVS